MTAKILRPEFPDRRDRSDQAAAKSLELRERVDAAFREFSESGEATPREIVERLEEQSDAARAFRCGIEWGRATSGPAVLFGWLINEDGTRRPVVLPDPRPDDKI